MGRAYRCEVCDTEPAWTVLRRGDVVVSWACDPHLAEVCRRLQRDWEVTELVVTDHAKAVEWRGIGATLDLIAKGKQHG